MNWFFLSLLAILFWSGSDFFSKLGSPARDKNSHLKMTAVVGITMGIHAVYMMTAGGVTVTLRDIIVYLPASLCYILSMAVGYAGLRYIELSVSSPVCNTSGAVAAILCAVFLGQSMGSMQFIGVAAVTAGVVALEAVDIKLDGRFAKKVLESDIDVPYYIRLSTVRWTDLVPLLTHGSLEHTLRRIRQMLPMSSPSFLQR